MANLIIKPTSGGSLVLQDEGGDAALTVGTTGSTTLAGTANNVGTVTGGTYNSTIGTSATMPAGSCIQLVTANGISEGTMTTSNNQWEDTVLTKTITPKYNNSQIMIFLDYNSDFSNTTGDAGFGTRMKRAITGGATSYPDSASMQEGTSNAHSVVYHGGNVTGNTLWITTQHHTLLDTPATTSAVVYTMQVASYNVESFKIGGRYTARWHIHLMEIKV